MNDNHLLWNELDGMLDYIAKIDAIVAYCKRNKTFYAKQWVDKLLEGNRPIYIFGAGQFGLDFYDQFLSEIGVSIEAYCDNAPAKWGARIFNGVPCISPAELMGRYIKSSCHVVITSGYFVDDIFQQCVGMGINETNLFPALPFYRSWLINYNCATMKGFVDKFAGDMKWLISQLSDDISKQLCLRLLYRRLVDCRIEIPLQGAEYFIPEFPIREDEVFVDVGAYTGDTLTEFVRTLSGQDVSSEKIQYYALECSPQNYSQLEDLCNQDLGFSAKVYQVALWDQNTELKFIENLSSGRMCQNGGIQVQACKLDDLIPDTPVTWIKMDIEGAELRALHGCEKLIRKYRPRLSICVYHCPNDIFEIPRYIKSLHPDYQILLRQHSEYDSETVLYAF